jgi:hypothetical protein
MLSHVSSLKWALTHALFLFVGANASAIANTVIFNEAFSGDLSAWTGKSGGLSQGFITADPLNAANNVLSFSGLNVSGDIFTASSLAVGNYEQVLISFDYLGLAKNGSVPGNLGGFLGLSLNLNPQGGDGAWLAGTDQSAANGLGFTGIKLIDDGAWHQYQIDITSLLKNNNISQIHLMLEDWKDAGGVPGDAFFDNITVQGIPVSESGTTASMLLASATLLMVGHYSRKRSAEQGGH